MIGDGWVYKGLHRSKAIDRHFPFAVQALKAHLTEEILDHSIFWRRNVFAEEPFESTTASLVGDLVDHEFLHAAF